MRKKKTDQPSFTQEAVSTMRAVMTDLSRERATRKDAEEIRQASTVAVKEDPELSESLRRLEASGVLFGINEKRLMFRVLRTPAEEHLAIKDGLSIWSPRDMFEYVHLPENQRTQLRRFKNTFSTGGFEWKPVAKKIQEEW